MWCGVIRGSAASGQRGDGRRRDVLVGATVGLLAAIGLGTAAGSQLYDLKGYDPPVLAASTALLVLVAFTAGLIPAMRASRVNPMTALRND